MRRLAIIGYTACVHASASGRAMPAVATPSTRSIPIAVTALGFVPDAIDVNTGKTVSFVFTRKVERTCVKRVVFELDGDRNVEHDLPIGDAVAITVTFDRPGELGFACAMAMKGGGIHVHPLG